MQIKRLVLSCIRLSILSVGSIAFAHSALNVSQPGITAASISKAENPVSEETLNILKDLVAQKSYAVGSIYLNDKTIHINSLIPEAYFNVTQDELDSGAKYVLNDVNQSFCSFKQQYPDAFNIYKKYDYDIVFMSSDYVFLGQVTVKPNQIDCSSFLNK